MDDSKFVFYYKYNIIFFLILGFARPSPWNSALYRLRRRRWAPNKSSLLLSRLTINMFTALAICFSSFLPICSCRLAFKASAKTRPMRWRRQRTRKSHSRVSSLAMSAKRSQSMITQKRASYGPGTLWFRGDGNKLATLEPREISSSWTKYYLTSGTFATIRIIGFQTFGWKWSKAFHR